MTVPLKRLSRAFVPLALFACALPAAVTLARQQREQTPATAASQSRSLQPPAPTATPRPASRPTPQPPTPAPQTPSRSVPQSSSQPDAQPSPPAAQVSEDEADLAITANVTASSVRFDAVPNVSVEFTGKPRRETAWEAERTNLPRPVQPGVTYRDVGVRLKIVSVFADIDRIVAEALGEVPPTDDGAQPNAPTPNAAPPASDTTTTERAAATSRAAETNEATATSDATATGDARPRTSTSDARPRASASRRARTRPSGRQR